MLDAGALLFQKQTILKSQRLQQLATTEGIIEAYNLMRYDAVGVAPLDLAAGLEHLLALKKKSNFTWLSANLADSANNELLFNPSTIIKKGDVRVGIIALTGPVTKPEQFKQYHWQQVLGDEIKCLKDQTDFLVLLSSYPATENQNIAKAFSELHLIIQAGGPNNNQRPRLINNTLISQTQQQGKYFGTYTIQLGDNGKWKAATQQKSTGKQNELDRLTWQLKRHRKHGRPEEVYKDRPHLLAAYYRLVERHEALREEIAQEKAQAATPQAGVSSTYKHRFQALDISLPNEQKVLNVVNATRARVNAIGRQNRKLTSQTAEPSVFASFVGWKQCQSCHETQVQSWQKSRHAVSFKTLVEKSQQFNLQCVPCHVTTMPEEIESTNLVPDRLRSVGCETCHGPGRSHIQDPQNNKPSQPSKELCLSCHSQEHDDNFNFSIDVKKLKCQGE